MVTPRVILFQILFVVIIWAASKLGKKPLIAVTVVLLLLTLIHLFFPAMLILQSTVILSTAAIRYHKIREQEARDMLAEIRSVVDRLIRP